MTYRDQIFALFEAEAADLAALREKTPRLEEQLRDARRDHAAALAAARVFMREERRLKAQIRRLEEIIEDLLHDQAAARAAALIADAEQAGIAVCADETEGGAK